jgi:hypothetical protein
MIIRSALCCAMLLGFATSAWCADKPASKKVVKAAPKPAAKIPRKAAPKTVSKTASKAASKTVTKTSLKPAAKPPLKQTVKPALKPAFMPTHALRGPTETLTCRDGTEDRHARIGVVLIGGKVDSFAYYSKWKPRTCSIYLQRNRDGYSKWIDKGTVTNVSLEHGLFLIEHHKGEYRFVFRDIDRERYCGMDGTINGTLTLRKGTERCELAGIMDEGVPLGQAVAQLEQTAATPAPAVPESVPDAAASKQLAQRLRRQPQSAWPAAAAGISD